LISEAVPGSGSARSVLRLACLRPATCAASFPPVTETPLPIVAHINDRSASREEVLAWERVRAVKVAGKLGVSEASADVATLRRTLVDRKLELGHEAIEKRLARPLWVAERVAVVQAGLARGGRRPCTIELSSPVGSAELIPGWYGEAIMANDEVPLIAACPDHWISRSHPDGRQEVIETTGGSPIPVRMFFDDSDLSTLQASPDPAFPVQWTAVARTAQGTPIGGIRHQFRDDAQGFRVRLTVEFPAGTLPHMVGAHRWHLACEFSNWLEAANGASG